MKENERMKERGKIRKKTSTEDKIITADRIRGEKEKEAGTCDTTKNKAITSNRKTRQK